MTYVFSSKFCEIFKNRFFIAHPWVTPSSGAHGSRNNIQKTVKSKTSTILLKTTFCCLGFKSFLTVCKGNYVKLLEKG